MTKQEIIDELNAACLHGLVSWVEASDGGFAAASPSKTVYLPPEEAAREATALRRDREALNLDAIMPMLEAIVENAASVGDDDDTPVEQYLDCFGNPDTVVGDVRAVLDAWKVRRQ